MSINHDWSYTEIEPNISPGGVILQAPLCSQTLMSIFVKRKIFLRKIHWVATYAVVHK